jgi:hypothetical protein
MTAFELPLDISQQRNDPRLDGPRTPEHLSMLHCNPGGMQP